jgi:hypothetical protein
MVEMKGHSLVADSAYYWVAMMEMTTAAHSEIAMESLTVATKVSQLAV